MFRSSFFFAAAFISAAFFASTPSRAGTISVVVTAGVNRSFDENLDSLRYAETDAERFARVMMTAGGVATENVAMLRNTTADEYLAAIQERVRVASGNSQDTVRLILYFSGHSDDRGLHFHDGPLPLSRLRKALSSVAASTKVIFVDSCFAGAIAAKGVETAEPFMLPKLDMDELSGSVFLTASSAREAAYESAELSGSLFTHFVLEGLQGAADGNKDGMVTVDELYQFVYRETRLQSLAYPKHAQHPEFHADLHGRGALVLARTTVSIATIDIDPGIMGTVHLMSMTSPASFTSPFNGTDHRIMQVPAGTYRAVIRRGSEIGEATVAAREGETVRVEVAKFTWHNPDLLAANTAKGLPSVASGFKFSMASGRSLGGDSDLTVQSLGISHEISHYPGWQVLGQIGATKNIGSFVHQNVRSFGPHAAYGVVRQWPGLSMRGIGGIGLERTWQEFDKGLGSIDHRDEVSPFAYTGVLLPIGQSQFGSLDFIARAERRWMDMADRREHDYDTFMIGVGVEP